MQNKKCKNCQYYTGTQCHGHGEYYGLCLKRKNRIIVDDETPCMHDLKTLRDLYYANKTEIKKLKDENVVLRIYKARYESKCRVVEKVQNMTLIACKYIAKENFKKWYKENLNFLINYKIPFEKVEKVINYGKEEINQNTSNTKD